MTATGTYTLTCTGAGGSANQSAALTVISGSSFTVSGAVDSALFNRKATNKVYLYKGTVTPDDYDGDGGDPMASAGVSQDANACTFGYTFSNIAPGSYTLAFTSQAASDIAGQNDAIVFIGSANVTVSANTTKNFAANRVLKVGPGKTYATPSAANAAALAGDVIEIDAGTYLDDATVWNKNNLVLRGVGGRAHMKATQMIGNGKAIWVTQANNITVENMEFSGARVVDLNGAGIRPEGGDITICNSYFHDNENGILGDAYNGTILIEYSEFDHNGLGEVGKTHNIYIGSNTNKLIFQSNYSHNANVGHELKTRAKENYVLYSRLMNESGTGSYTLDVPNGGLMYMIGNLIQQGPNSPNSRVVNYASEVFDVSRINEMYIINNSFVNDRNQTADVFIEAAAATPVIRLTNNLFVGNGKDVNGAPANAITKLTNLYTNTPEFVNRVNYDYRLLATSPAINKGSALGSARGFNLAPAYQYTHKTQRQTRPNNEAMDIGAYEYLP